jgi:23S rRNA (adenine2030-N6)-methyltransferase
MNYRHAFHAGNFADVHKHVVLARVIAHLQRKPTPIRMIDTHAGAGLTDLTGPEASRTGEWHEGIERLRAAAFSPDVQALLQPYLDAVARFNPDGRLTAYPGSPLLATAWLRGDDRLLACELEPDVARSLAQNLKAETRATAVAIDGFTALAAFLPPKERRGVVLIDPPFELPDEFARLADGLVSAHRKWPTGIYLLWYPIKEPRQTKAFAARIMRLKVPKILRTELQITGASDQGQLLGSGLLIVNPPWTLESELKNLLPALTLALSRDPGGGFNLGWLVPEK